MHANQRAQGYCEQGNKIVVTGGLSGAPKAQASYPRCTVTVYLAGTTTLATVYSDNLNTALANPFTASSTGLWFFYASNGRYDVRLNGGGIPAPFTIGDILLNDLGFATRAGTVMVYPPRVQNGSATAVAPNGTLISCAGSTTSCLQEAENYRYNHGYDMHIVGGNEPSGCSPGPSCAAVVYNATTTLAFNPMEGANIDSGAFTLNCTFAIGSNPCLSIDSLEMANISFPGTQIVNAGTGPTILIKPTNPVPLDVAFGIGLFGSVYIFTAVNTHSPASDVAAVPLIDFDSSLGPITYSNFEFDEVNASGIGIRVKDPAVGKGFNANTIKALYIHDQQGTNPMVSVGQTAVGGSRISLNKWNLFLGFGGQNPTGKGVSTFEQAGLYDLNVGIPGLSYGLFFETGAAGNTVRAGQITGGTLQPSAQSVGGDCTKNQLINSSATGPIEFSITPPASGSPYTNQTCQPLMIISTGGTVSDISIGSVAGNVLSTGQTSGAWTLRPGAVIRWTYSVAPSIAGII
jgi:hypothetical protein